MTQHAFRHPRFLRATLLCAGLVLAAAPTVWISAARAQDQQQDQQQAPKDGQTPQDQQDNPPVKNNDASGGLQAGGVAAPSGADSAAATPATEPAVPADARPLTPQLYAETAAVNNMFEIEASKLALTKSNNKDVKTFARHMIQDHEEAEVKLEGVIQDKQVGVTLPKSMDQKHQDLLTQLEGLNGDAFDKAYVKMLLLGHREALKLHQSYADNGDTVELKTFAVTAVPMVEKHLERIEKIAKAMKISA